MDKTPEGIVAQIERAYNEGWEAGFNYGKTIGIEEGKQDEHDTKYKPL